ncbi:hypothetical protein GCM10027299_41620 [Larkinella ripae]
MLSHKFHPDIGGIESISEGLATSFVEEGHEIHILTWSTSSSKDDFPYEVIRKPGFKQLVSEHLWADIIFENNPCIQLSWVGGFLNRPSVISLQTWIGSINEKLNWKNYLKIKWLSRAKYVIACSEAVKNRCWPASLVIGNPYKAESFKRVDTIPKTKDFIFLGRLVSDKGADLAIQAFYELTKRMQAQQGHSQKMSLTIVGNGPERQKLEQLVLELNLQDHILFTGALRGKSLVDCLNQHRFLVVPSNWEEPFGIVALEGMACGCLPIVSDGGGLPDAVGEAGLIFKRGSVNSLVEVIWQLLNDVDLEEKLRDAAPQHLVAHHQAVVAGKYLKLFTKALNT